MWEAEGVNGRGGGEGEKRVVRWKGEGKEQGGGSAWNVEGGVKEAEEVEEMERKWKLRECM